MARPLRIEFEGGLYHVTARGNERREIFMDEKDFLKMEELLSKYVERLGVKIHCYALMNNHYHLIIETPSGNLTAFMHNAQSHYTGYFNRRHGRVGHLFQGRYKGLVVDRDAYLLELSRYVHLNPVRAGMVKRPEEWRWSSYHQYVETGKGTEKWVVTDDVLKYFGKRRKPAAEKYIRYVAQGMEEPQDDLFADVTAQLILGSEQFVEKIKERISGKNKPIAGEIVSGRELTRWSRKEAEAAITKIAKAYSINKSNITRKGSYKNIERDIAILTFHRMSRWTVGEIGEIFGISGSGVSKRVARVERSMENDHELTKELENILSIFTA